jgi:gamma-glutamyltranspeptidase
VQSALELPRFSKRTFEGCDLSLEQRVPGDVVERLRKMGHVIELRKPFDSEVGNGQAILRDGRGVLYAGSDPRKDGASIPANPQW